MDVLQKILRLSLLGLFLSLLIGVSNLPHQPKLWILVALLVAVRAAELFHPASEALVEWHRSSAHPRWLNWLAGLTFLTNVALPILDYRYRGEVFWTSPLPADVWWSWLGMLGVLAGVALRWQAFTEVPKPQKPAAPVKAASKRKRSVAEQPLDVPQFEAGYLAHLHQQFSRAAAATHFGSAILLTSLWGLLALVIIVLPIMLYRHEANEQAATS